MEVSSLVLSSICIPLSKHAAKLHGGIVSRQHGRGKDVELLKCPKCAATMRDEDVPVFESKWDLKQPLSRRHEVVKKKKKRKAAGRDNGDPESGLMTTPNKKKKVGSPTKKLLVASTQ